MVFMSESQGFFKETKHNLALARTNRLLGQRDMSTGKFAFEKQAARTILEGSMTAAKPKVAEYAAACKAAEVTPHISSNLLCLQTRATGGAGLVPLHGTGLLR